MYIRHSALNPINSVDTTLSAFWHRFQTQGEDGAIGNTYIAAATQCYFKVHKMSSGPPVNIRATYNKENVPLS